MGQSNALNITPSATTGVPIISNGTSTSPSFSTATVAGGGTGLTATTANEILYSSANNTIAGLATANNGVLATNGSGIPSITATPTVTSITFGTGSALNNYVGLTAFTPTIGGATSTGTTTYLQQDGKYTRIGNMVYVVVVLQWSSTTGTGRMRINNLPYTADGPPIQYQAAAQFGGMTLTANYTNLSFQTIGGTKSAESQISGSGQNSAAFNIPSSGYVGWCCWYSV